MPTNKEILEKAITKAIDGGWRETKNLNISVGMHDYQDTTSGIYYITIGTASYDLNTVIFNKGFAKALWGDRSICICTGEYPKKSNDRISPPTHVKDCPKMWPYEKGYVYHLQQMVISDDPIKYLGENI